MEEDEKTRRLEENTFSGSDETIRMDLPPDEYQTRILKDENISIKGKTAPEETIYELKGIPYRVIKTISENTSEAQIYKVENQGKVYALKLFYPNFHPKEELQAIIKDMNFEMVVKLYEYGTVRIGNSVRTFELMEYLQGGNLTDYKLNGRADIFKKIALSASAALFFCHRNNIIHKDIKPGNFFFRDKEQTQIVLGDFGISSLCDEEEILHKTTQARTPVYAAPEMYTNVIDGEVELSPMIDFYSLGISLLSVWLEENPFIGNERLMMRMKMEGKLPKLDQLPPDICKLIRGLTVVDPAKRWGYEEVERWYKGENVPIDASASTLRYSTFVFDPEKNLIANDAKELAALINENKKLGIKYLYSKRIYKWLEECGNQKLAVEIEDIIEKRFPLNQNAGILAAIYTLDPDFPYYDVTGTACLSAKELADSVIKNAAVYERLLTNENDNFYFYLEMAGHPEDADRFKGYFKNSEPHVALWRVIYEIGNNIPFLQNFPSSNSKEIVEAFATGQCGEDEWKSLTDGRLLSWLQAKNEPEKYGEIKSLTAGQNYSRNLAYGVLYYLDKETGFDLKDAVTSEKIGGLISKALQSVQYANDKEFSAALQEYIDEKGRLAYYCQVHGWENILKFKDYCFDIHSVENEERCGIYNLRIAAYKFCAGIGHTPSYLIKNSDNKETEIRSLTELEAYPLNKVKEEAKTGSLKAWLTIFFHENPFATFDKKYDYELSLEKYLRTIGRYDASDVHYKRFSTACNSVNEKIDTGKRLYKQALSREITCTFILGITAAFLIYLLYSYGISNKNLFISQLYYSLGIPFGIIGIFLSARQAFYSGQGTLVILLFAIGGGVLSVFPIVGMKWLMLRYPGYEEIIGTTLVLLYLIIVYMTVYRNSIFNLGNLKPLFSKNEKTILMEPLYHAYKSAAYKFKGSNFGALDDSIDLIRGKRRGVITHYVGEILLICILIAEFVYFHPHILDKKVPHISTSLQEIMSDIDVDENLNELETE